MMQSTATHSASVELINSESERVKKYLSSLPPEALESPTPCAMWNVGEVIAHLIWFADVYGGMMERGLRGDVSPTEGFPGPGILSGSEIHERYGQAAIDLRLGIGQHLLPAFNDRYDWLNDMLKGIGPGDWDKPCYHTSKIRSVESFIPTIFTKLAIHEWDIRSTLEASPSLPPSVTPIIIDRIPNRNRPWAVAFPVDVASQSPIHYRFELTGPGARNFDLVVDNNIARLAIGGDAAASVSFRCDTATFALLMWERISLESAKSCGLLTEER